MTSRKYLVVLGDGMADEPIAELEGKTPLEYARTPNFDRIAREGACGMVRTIPPGFEAGSDIANLSLLGYDPKKFYTGRGPLEAASMGVPLGEGDIAYRCNLVTVTDGVMEDFSAGHIPSSQGGPLIQTVAAGVEGVSLYAGVSYRNLMVVPGGKGSVTTPPHDIVGEDIKPHLPRGGDAEVLVGAMKRSREILRDQPVNRERISRGERPATMVWPWSGGRKPDLPSFRDLHGISGAMISAVDLLNGIARLAGMEVIRVPGATGYLDTDYGAKARYAQNALEQFDFLYLHVEAPDEASHMGSIEEKVRAIERVDGMVGTIMETFQGIIAVLPDHATPIRLRNHTPDPVPFAVRGLLRDGTRRLTEREAAKGIFGTIEAVDLIPLLLKKSV